MANSTLSDYKNIIVQGKHFGDKVQSTKFLLPKNFVYTLYKDKDFKGSALSLKGTGSFEGIPDLEKYARRNNLKNISKKISSSQFTKGTA